MSNDTNTLIQESLFEEALEMTEDEKEAERIAMEQWQQLVEHAA